MAVPSGPAFYEALIAALPDGVLIADRRGAIVYANRQLAQLSGYASEELLGMTVDDLVPAAFAPRHHRNRAAYYRTGRPVRPMGTHLQIRLATKDGREIPVDIALSPMSGDSELVVAAVRDASESPAHLPLIHRAGFGPLMIGPLAAGDHSHGVLSIGRHTGGPPFGPQDLAVASAFASQAVVALEFGRARDELQRLAILGDRERIGRELHDGVIQSLFAVGMNLQAVAISASPELQARLERAVTEIDAAIRDLRNYIFGLRPGLLADRQLSQVMATLADQLESESGLAVAVVLDPNLAAVLTPRAGDVVQLLREALSNVARHSGAETCRITLRREANEAVLVVDDDGHGFNPASVEAGQGLDNMRARADAIGGSLEVETAAERGTTLTFRFPV